MSTINSASLHDKVDRIFHKIHAVCKLAEKDRKDMSSDKIEQPN